MSAAQVLESKLLLARDLLKEEPVNTELLKEVTEAPSPATRSILTSVLPTFFMFLSYVQVFPNTLSLFVLLSRCFTLLRLKMPCVREDLRTEVRDIVKRKARVHSSFASSAIKA